MDGSLQSTDQKGTFSGSPEPPLEVKDFVLYFQPVGPSAQDPTPIVLCVGPQERCEQMRKSLLASPDFIALLARERHGRLQIAPASSAAYAVPARVKYYHSRVGDVSAIRPI